MQGLLNHTVIDEAEELDGVYKQAFDRILNQVGSASLLSVCSAQVFYLHELLQHVD